MSAAVALTAAAGYWLAAGRLSWKLAAVWLGVFVLACGACALNQYQERAAAARMRRTRGQPISSGRLLPSTALAISIGVLACGAGFLFASCGFVLKGCFFEWDFMDEVDGVDWDEVGRLALCAWR
ncbi:MAG: UbiA family prenyltransferase [Candidatus Sumerlaeota bacterium]|nr:UbiA family prenyltransferase [Candidatus Sumerlaeota bacterium]